MKQILLTFLLLCLGWNAASAQCGGTNTAFSDGETLDFDLYFNWSFVWVKVGTAKWEVKQTTYAGKPSYRTYLITSTNRRADKFFVMRDTLTAYTTTGLVPLAFNKHAHEGSYYRVDDVRYSYNGGKCTVDMTVNKNYRGNERKQSTFSTCVYDMVSIDRKSTRLNSSH